MISLQEARRIIAESIPAPGSEVLPLKDALGRVLTTDLLSDAFYPSGDRSMMDGYALPGDASPGDFRVTGEIPAGGIPRQSLQAGEAVRIFTGALVPEGAARVLPQELAERSGDIVRIGGFPASRFIRPKGSEAAPGDRILPAGTRLGAAELAILAQLGAVAPRVVKRPLIRHIATGGELVDPAEIPSAGQIRDTNTTLLAALLADLGAGPLLSCRCGDDPVALAGLCGPPCDLLLVSGGASVGDHDHGAEALRRLGFTILFDRVNLRPGKPLTFATRGHQLAFVIPGNPVSHFVCFHVAIRLAVELLHGLPPAWDFLDLEISGGEPLRPDPRETYWPARIRAEAGRLVVTPRRWSTSGDTFALAGTNALVRVVDTPPAGRAPTLPLQHA
jgi:molybdopterin molybdotransferase